MDLPAAAGRSVKALRRGLRRRAVRAAMKRTRRRWRLPSVPTGAGARRQVPDWAHARGDGEPRRGGASVGQVAGDFGAEPCGGARADAFDLAERLDVRAPLGRGLDVGGDLCVEAGGFLFQRAHDAGEAFGDERIGGAFGAVALGLEHGGEIGAAAHEGAQELLRGAGGLPGGQCGRGAEAGDERGVEAVGLVAVAEAARGSPARLSSLFPSAVSVVLDAARVGDVDAVAGGVQPGGGQFAGATGGFEHGERRGRAVLFAPGAQRGDAGRGVVELRVARARALEQAGVEFGLGDVEAQAGADGFGEDHGGGGGICDAVVVVAGRFEASPVERGLVCGLPPAILAVLDTIRLRAGEAAGTGAVLIYGLVVPSRGRFTRPAASNGPCVLYYGIKSQAGGRA